MVASGSETSNGPKEIDADIQFRHINIIPHPMCRRLEVTAINYLVLGGAACCFVAVLVTMQTSFYSVEVVVLVVFLVFHLIAILMFRCWPEARRCCGEPAKDDGQPTLLPKELKVDESRLFTVYAGCFPLSAETAVVIGQLAEGGVDVPVVILVLQAVLALLPLGFSPNGRRRVPFQCSLAVLVQTALCMVLFALFPSPLVACMIERAWPLMDRRDYFSAMRVALGWRGIVAFVSGVVIIAVRDVTTASVESGIALCVLGFMMLHLAALVYVFGYGQEVLPAELRVTKGGISDMVSLSQEVWDCTHQLAAAQQQEVWEGTYQLAAAQVFQRQEVWEGTYQLAAAQVFQRQDSVDIATRSSPRWVMFRDTKVFWLELGNVKCVVDADVTGQDPAVFELKRWRIYEGGLRSDDVHGRVHIAFEASAQGLLPHQMRGVFDAAWTRLSYKDGDLRTRPDPLIRIEDTGGGARFPRSPRWPPWRWPSAAGAFGSRLRLHVGDGGRTSGTYERCRGDYIRVNKGGVYWKQQSLDGEVFVMRQNPDTRQWEVSCGSSVDYANNFDGWPLALIRSRSPHQDLASPVDVLLWECRDSKFEEDWKIDYTIKVVHSSFLYNGFGGGGLPALPGGVPAAHVADDPGGYGNILMRTSSEASLPEMLSTASEIFRSRLSRSSTSKLALTAEAKLSSPSRTLAMQDAAERQTAAKRRKEERVQQAKLRKEERLKEATERKAQKVEERQKKRQAKQISNHSAEERENAEFAIAKIDDQKADKAHPGRRTKPKRRRGAKAADTGGSDDSDSTAESWNALPKTVGASYRVAKGSRALDRVDAE